ncbi:uncharacterized protein LOC141827923 [Curcuma longa]|uniref:uncharacterized protein LOC141827923 n=1 Tax=Curcuma longa TaxID=136217 RepID=UPI003D9F5C30
MGSGRAAPRVRRWTAMLALVLTSFWRSIPSALGEAADGEGGDLGASAGGAGGGRLLLSFQEVKGNASFRCSPSGPCLPCQYSEKNDDKYRCSETGFRVPLKCIQVNDSTDEAKKIKARRKLLSLENQAYLAQKQLFTTLTNYKWRKLLAASSKSENKEETYITYRSCEPVDREEKISLLGFEVIMAGLLLISGSVVYLRQKRTALMPGVVAPVRIPSNSPRFSY